MQENTILTITGSDSTGESGVQADIKTITALGCTAVSAITTITLQNTLGIQEFFDVPPAVVGGQIEAIVNDVPPAVVKIGLVRSRGTVKVIVDALRRHRPRYVIYDPVLFSTRGDRLMGDSVLQTIRDELFPLCSVIVVARRDASGLTGQALKARVCQLADNGCHGMANGFSSSLAVFLCHGDTLDEAIGKATDYSRRQVSVTSALRGRADQLYNDFVRLLQQHCGHSNDVAFYADRLNVGSAYLGQVCRKVAGRSPKTIIDDCLLRAVERELTATTDNIQQIALRLGFSSQAHLSAFFKKLTGMSPREYRSPVSQ